MKLQPGAFIQLLSQENSNHQVLTINDHFDQCWIRRWPLSTHGSPPFAVSLQQLMISELEAA
jgi:hypothetical protein